jgi:hypothetical protein
MSSLDRGASFWFLLSEFALPLIWLAFLPWALVAAIASCLRRAVVDAALACSVLIIAVLVVLEGRYVGDFVRFQIERPHYVAALAAARSGHVSKDLAIAVDPPMLAYFEWGAFLSISYGVVYDQTDEIAKEPEERSDGWSGSRASDVLDCPADVRALGGHFYAAHISC